MVLPRLSLLVVMASSLHALNLETTVALNNGVKMPYVGIGTAGLGRSVYDSVKYALQAGYKLIDSAQAKEWYREDLVGKALADLDVKRSDVFITSKLHPRHLGYETTKRQFDESLKDLRTDYLDLFLLHYPHCWMEGCPKSPEGTYLDSWRAMEELQAAGKVRAIGVSNFEAADMNRLLKAAKRGPPQVLQNWMDPFQQARPMRELCEQHGIFFQAYSSLGSQWTLRPEGKKMGGNPVFKSVVLQHIANSHGKAPEWSVARVVMDWQIQRRVGVVPRSSRWEGVKANAMILQGAKEGELALALTEAELSAIDALDGTMAQVLAEHERTNADEVHIIFKNELRDAVKLYWVGPDEEVDQGRLLPGGEHAVNTFHGHHWLIKTVGGHQLEEMRIDKGNGKKQFFSIEQGEL